MTKPVFSIIVDETRNHIGGSSCVIIKRLQNDNIYDSLREREYYPSLASIGRLVHFVDSHTWSQQTRDYGFIGAVGLVA